MERHSRNMLINILISVCSMVIYAFQINVCLCAALLTYRSVGIHVSQCACVLICFASVTSGRSSPSVKPFQHRLNAVQSLYKPLVTKLPCVFQDHDSYAVVQDQMVFLG